MTAIRAGAATDRGLVRSNNQDRLLVAPPLFAVADGMGGHAAGEVASSTAVEALQAAYDAMSVNSPESLTPQSLAEAAKIANKAVWDKARSDPSLRGMGTTLVAAALVSQEGSEAFAVVNVGDSRVYRLRNGRLEQLTTDHSVVAEMVAGGELAEEEAEFHPQRHVLTRAIGVDPTVPVDLNVVIPEHGDRYLLCSDGLPREVSEMQIASVLRRFSDPTETAKELLSEAKLRGGSDNITAVVLDLLPSASALSAPGNDEVGKGQLQRRAAPNGSHEAPSAAGKDSSGRTRLNPLQRPRARLVTFRVVGFFILLLVILGVAAAGTALYARASYFVGLDGNRLTIFRGRPGGLLWFQPTVAQRSNVTTSQVEPRHLPALRAGVEEATLVAARRYVANLKAEWLSAQAADRPHLPASPSSTTTTSRQLITTTTPPTRTGARAAGWLAPWAAIAAPSRERSGALALLRAALAPAALAPAVLAPAVLAPWGPA